MNDTNQSSDRRARPLALGQVESYLKDANPDLDFYLVGQAHYGELDFAFIEVYGIEDRSIMRRIRKEAGERLQDLGFPVDLIESKDIFRVTAIQPD